MLQHHRVPKEKGRGPRVNINFRYILPDRNETSIRGVRTFYKYMVSGDAHTEDWKITAPTCSYAQIVAQSGPMYAFARKSGTCVTSTGANADIAKSSVAPQQPQETVAAVTATTAAHTASNKRKATSAVIAIDLTGDDEENQAPAAVEQMGSDKRAALKSSRAPAATASEAVPAKGTIEAFFRPQKPSGVGI
jgi:hypothetical protein